MKLRRLGGSDIAKLLGVSKYGNARDVYDRCALGLEEGWKPIMQRGAVHEPHLRAIGQTKFGFELEPHNGQEEAKDYYPHAFHEFAWAQIDDLARWRGMSVCVDYKTTSIWAQKMWGPDGSDEVPEQYRAQFAWEMACTDRDLCIALVGFGEDDKQTGGFEIRSVVSYFVERDPIFESHCLAVAKDFWLSHAVPGVPPNMKPIGKNKRKAA